MSRARAWLPLVALIAACSGGTLPFDQNLWKQQRFIAEPDRSDVRHRMLPDLLKSHPLVGMSRQQVEDLLGAPESYANAGGNELYYLLKEEWSGVDPTEVEHLVLDVDATGHVTQSRVTNRKSLHGA